MRLAKKLVSTFLIFSLLICLSQTNVLGSSLIGTPGANLPNPPGTFDPPDGDFDESYYVEGYDPLLYVAETRDEVQPVNGYVSTQATKAFKVSGLSKNFGQPIQSFFVGSTYLYATRTNGTTVYLTRFTISGSNAVKKDRMVLKNIGKNQILEGYTYNGKMYFWIGCKPNPDVYNGDVSNMPMQLGRIQYSADATISSYTDIVRFGYLDCANTSGTSFATPVSGKSKLVHRVDAGLSSDKTKIIIATRSCDGKIQYSQYSNAFLNQVLDEAEANGNKFVSFAQNPNLINGAGCEFSCVQNVGERVLPNQGFQGMDVTSGYYSIYISGGTGVQGYENTKTAVEGDGINQAKTPIIAKMIRNSSGGYTYSKAVKITNNLSDYINDRNETVDSKYLNATEFPPEIEGVKIVGDYLYFVLYPTVLSLKQNVNYHYIYKINKNLLS